MKNICWLSVLAQLLPDDTNRMPARPLIRAVGNTALERIKRLLAEGQDVNSQNALRMGRTALHWAMKYNRVKMVRQLLARPETRLDITDKYGNTPLHRACSCRHNSRVATRSKKGQKYGKKRRLLQHMK